MARDSSAHRGSPGAHLSLRPKPGKTEVALGKLGQCYRRGPLARFLGYLFLIYGQFRYVERDLRLAGRRDRLHAVDVVVDHGHPTRWQAECGDRASDSAR